MGGQQPSSQFIPDNSFFCVVWQQAIRAEASECFDVWSVHFSSEHFHTAHTPTL